MKRFLPFKLMMLPVLLMVAFLQGNAQPLMTENFDYANGTLLTAAGWTAHSGTATNPADVVVPGLTFPGYALSNIGGAARIDNTGEDVNKTFASQSSGSIYVAFTVQVDVMASGYFLHLGQTAMGSTYFGRVWLNAGTAGGYKLGLGKGSETTPVLTAAEYTPGTTYLAVLKYNIIDGAANDEISLYVINGSIPATEPATASIPAFTNSATDYAPGSIGLRQYDGSQRITIDGIRIGKTWAEAVTANTSADVTPPVFNSGFPKVTGIKATQADLQVNLDEAGKAYFAAVKDGDPAPTAAQVFAGVNYGTVTLVAAGNITLASGGTVGSATLSGLTDKTNYDVYVVAQDDEATPNRQTTPVKVDLYTINPPDVIVKADFNTSLAPFTQVSLEGNEVWELFTIPSTENKCAKMSGYIAPVYWVNTDYLISPAINLDASTLNKVSFTNAKNYTGPALKVLISANFDGNFNSSAVKAATWTDISSNFAYSTGSFTFVPSGEFSLATWTGKVYIAFVYESTTSQAATWEIDDFQVTGYLKGTGIGQLEETDITLYPVPAKDEIRFGNINGVLSLDILDIHGRLLKSVTLHGQTQTIVGVSHLKTGLYLVRFNTSGLPVVKKFIKE